MPDDTRYAPPGLRVEAAPSTPPAVDGSQGIPYAALGIPTAPVDDAARYAPGAKAVAPYSPFVGGGPPLPRYVPPPSKPIPARVWWILGGSVIGLILVVVIVRAISGGGGGGGMSRDKMIAAALAALAEEDVDKLVELSIPSTLRVNDCKEQNAAEQKRRARAGHRDSIRRLRRYMNRKDLDNVKIAMLEVDADRDPTHYEKGSPAMGARGEECEYTRELTVHRLRVDVRVNGDIEDTMRIAAIELDGAWYLGDFLLGGAILNDDDE